VYHIVHMKLTVVHQLSLARCRQWNVVSHWSPAKCRYRKVAWPTVVESTTCSLLMIT